jgi:hypothetical protein
VTDANGAAVPGAVIILTDKGTGATRTTTTDSWGSYRVTGLLPGYYSLQVNALGFKTAVIDGISVHPGQTVLRGVYLEAANAAETVNVVVFAPLLDPTSAQSSAVVESRKVRELPNLHPTHSLARLLPGAFINTARRGGEPPTMGGSSGFLVSLANAQPRSISHTIDGVDNSDIDGQPAVSIDSFDALEMVHVLTTRGSGDVSLTGASSVNLLTRTGSNLFHGSAFDYYLNRRFGALSRLERRSGLTHPPTFKNTVYGATLGGPIRRDRAFFFGSFLGETETSRRFVDSTPSFLTPSAAATTALRQLHPGSEPLKDLARRGPFATLAPARTVRSFSYPVLGTPVDFVELVRSIPGSAEGYEVGSRVSLNATSRDLIEFRYWYDSRSVAASAGRLESGYTASTSGRSQLGGLHWNRVLSPISVNELHIGVGRARSALLGDPQPLIDGEQEGATAGPGVVIALPGLSFGQSPLVPQSHITNSIYIGEMLSRVEGRHNFKAGAQVRRRSASFDYLPGVRAQYYYAGFADFIQDRPVAMVAAAGARRFSAGETLQHYYIDDGWRARENLTLFFGLSYENAGQPLNGLARNIARREEMDQTSLFNPDLPLSIRTIEQLNRDNNNVAPRLGFAYTPRFRVFGRDLFGRDKMVVRGSAAVSYDSAAYRPLAETAASSPNVLLAVFGSQTEIPFPRFPAVPSRAELSQLFGADPRNFARTVIDPGFRTPYSIRWHLAASRSFSDKALFELGYTGARGVGLVRALDGNALSSSEEAGSAGPLRVYASTGQSSYNAIHARLDLRVLNSLEAGFSYAFSKLIDDVPFGAAHGSHVIGSPFALAVAGHQSFAQNPLDISRGERGLSSLDRRHLLVGHYVWSLPLPRSRNQVLAQVLRGWQATGILEVGSGSPYTPAQQFGDSPEAFALLASGFSERIGTVRPFLSNPAAPPDVVVFSNGANAFYRFFSNSDGTPFQSPTGFIVASRTGFRAGSVGEGRFVYNDFAVEQAALARGLPVDAFGRTFAQGRAFGDAGRNTLVGPNLANLDFALVKTTKLNEKVSLQVRAEFYNAFNHPHRAVPVSILEMAGGRGFADPGETDATPRRVRIGVKLSF